MRRKINLIKSENLAWIFVLSLDLSLIITLFESRNVPLLIGPPLVYLYILLGIITIIGLHKIVNENKSFVLFLKEVVK